ncbi:sulfur carrier protein ThiS [Thermodesulfovibrio thiophilus]|uniref:sulfur carrier protein ThiS n=1 Tax=Thermodesulfovibrio thiophilus TaxID=340095 RepID=UPI0004105F22|nr:sulfur carrier protein ThiS [Thermodesulfovibrio thiophilus]
MINVKVNGVLMNVSASTIAELLSELQIDPDRVVVEVNLEIVKKERFNEFTIKDGDSIEIVNFVGGGG